MIDAPPFDPSQPFQPIGGVPATASAAPPPFDPSKPYEAVGGPSPGMAEGTIRAAATGVPILGGLSNKIDAAINAALAPVVDPMLPDSFQKLPESTFGERYQHALDIQNAKDQQFATAHPVANTAAEIGGGVAAMLPVAGTALGARLLGLTGGGLLARTGASALSGTALGAADAATRGDDVGTGAEIGLLTGIAGPIAGKAIGSIVEGARGLVAPKITLPTADEIAAAATKSYSDPAIAGVQFKSNAVGDLVDSIKSDLNGKRINDRLAGQTHGILDDLKTDPINPSGYTVEDLETTRRLLGDVAGNFTNKTDATAAIRAKQMIDNYLGKVPQADLAAGDAPAANAALLKARADYAAAQRMNTVEGKVEAAENQAAVANSGQNIDNATRQRINDILKSPKLRRGFSADEIVAMQQVARGTAPGNMLRFVGNLLGGGGGLAGMATGTAAALSGAGPAGFLVPAAGYAIKKAGNALTGRNVNTLLDTIASSAPSAAPQAAARAAAQAARQARLQMMERAAVLSGRAAIPALDQPARVGQ